MVPAAIHNGFDFLVVMSRGSMPPWDPGVDPPSTVTDPHSDRRVISWMQRHSRFVNSMPETGLSGGMVPTLDPQEYFNKVLEMVPVLHPPSNSVASKR